MKRLIAVLLLLSNCAYADGLITKVDKSVVLVESIINKNNGGYGTGFAVANNGVIATNFHVIRQAVTINLYTVKNGERPVKHPATIIWTSPELDLALLSAPTVNLAPLPLFDGVPEKGDQVFAIGFPGNANENVTPDRLESTATQGIVGRYFKSAWHDSDTKFGIVQHSAPINHGNSGGPLVDTCGRVVGINTELTLGKVIQDPKAGFFVVQSDGVSFASNASELVKALKSQGIIGSIFTDTCSSTLSAPNLENSSRTNWLFLLALLGASALAGGALFVALRKPTFLSESYTQYIKRSKPRSDATIRKLSNWAFVGKTENGSPVRLKVMRSNLESRHLTIGRDSSGCDLVINDSSVSRRHATLALVAGRLMLSDSNSTNGTYIDGARIFEQPVAIKIGQKLLIGKVSILVEEA